MNKHVVLTNDILVNKAQANIDAKYGPYKSIEEAFNILQDYECLAIGLTVGILDKNGVINEYWFKSGCSTKEDLVIKYNNKIDSLYDNGTVILI